MKLSSLASIQALIIDMDGVLWRGAEPLPGVADFFEFLAQNSIRALLATNNATRSADFAVERMRRLGVSMRTDQVLTSANATARWLAHQLPAGSPALVVGEVALFQELERAGFQAFDAGDPSTEDQPMAAVVVGLDRKLTYDKLRRANAAIRAGAKFVATNGDPTFPTEHALVPGAGSVVAAVQTASGMVPSVVGKPFQPMFDTALELVQTPRQRTAMLGDRLDTDIEGGYKAGLQTILVLTGVTTAEEAAASSIKPDFTFRNLMELRKQWAADLAQD
jgi:4-nitrophenyl phosphatase